MKNLKMMMLMLTLFGCGSNSIDPLQLTDPSFPTLGSIQSGNIFSNLKAGTGFNSTTPYWTFTGLYNISGGAYSAPASGIVSEVGITTAPGTLGYSMVILHSGRLATRISGMQIPTVQVGNSVVAGQVIATFYTGSDVTFQVLVDNAPVCPLSYMNTSFRQNFTSFGYPPCQ